MTGQIFGVQLMDFVAQGGDKVSGCKLYFMVPSRKVVGNIPGTFFMRPDTDIYRDLMKAVAGDVNTLLGKKINVEYNTDGKVESLSLAG